MCGCVVSTPQHLLEWYTQLLSAEEHGCSVTAAGNPSHLQFVQCMSVGRKCVFYVCSQRIVLNAFKVKHIRSPFVMRNLDTHPVILMNHLCVCCLPDIWSEPSFQTDADLPPGWKKITDMAGIYYWHIPTGATQWERPITHPAPSGQTESQAMGDHTASTPQHSMGSLSPSPTPDQEVSNTKQNPQN